MHLQTDGEGKLSASLDDPDEQAMGLEATEVVLKGDELSVNVPVVQGRFKGTVSRDGKTISGIWTKPPQAPLPLVFTLQARASDEPDDTEP